MSLALRLTIAAVVAVAVETASVWVLIIVASLYLSMAFAIAVAAGYVALFAASRVLSPSGDGPPLGVQLRASSLCGLAALLIVEATLYFCDGLLHMGLLKTNTLVLIAVACWVALGWRFMGGELGGPRSGSASAERRG